MTFRINFIQHDGAQWFCDVERIDGGRTTVELYTDRAGRGLMVEDVKGNKEPLIPEDSLLIPPGSSSHEASVTIASALVMLGWGPEIDRHGVVVQHR